MIRWVSSQSRLTGFTFYPAWEICFGLFLVMSAVALPVLFFKYNGFQAKQYPEWLFCLGFVVFFGWMGKALIFQVFLARIEADRVVIEHNLREPAVRIDRPLADWRDTLARETRGDKGESFHLLVLAVGTEAVELYRSINQAEVEDLQKALQTLHRSAIPEVPPSPEEHVPGK